MFFRVNLRQKRTQIYDKKYAFQAILSNFEGGLRILHWGVGGGVENKDPG